MARERRRQLRAALVYHGQVVADVMLAPGARLCVGESGAHGLTVRPVGLCEGFEVLRSSSVGERGVLRMTTAVTGWSCLGGRERSLRELSWSDSRAVRVAGSVVVVGEDDESPTPGPSPSGEGSEASTFAVAEATVLEIDLKPDDWGVLVLGESELVFQWVLPQAAPWRLSAVGGLAWWAVPARAPALSVALLLSLVLQGAVLFAASWPRAARSAASSTTASVAVETRWVEYHSGAVEEVVERPAVGRLRHAVRRVLHGLGTPGGVGDVGRAGESGSWRSAPNQETMEIERTVEPL